MTRTVGIGPQDLGVAEGIWREEQRPAGLVSPARAAALAQADQQY
ncbi:hypothetical protein [Nocardia testacea]|nr:hypothetical protein [Nocardia testacea]